MALLFEDKISSNKPAFIAKVNSVASNLGIDPNWLMTIMWTESHLDPTISNQQCVKDTSSTATCAVGLIQFLPSTATGLGTSVDSLKNMSNVQQLDFIYKYYYPVRNKITSFADLYLYTFNPASVGKGDDYIIGSSSGEISKFGAGYPKRLASLNRGVNTNANGVITVGSYKQWLSNKYPDLLSIKSTVGTPIIHDQVSATVKAEKYVKQNEWLVAIFFLLVIIGIVFMTKYFYKKMNKKQK